MDESYRIRPARPADSAALSEIERSSFGDPWSPEGFRQALAGPGSFGLVADRGGLPLGYLFGRQMADEGEILNLAVAPRYRRGGVGGALLHAGLAWFLARKVREVFLEVRESNQAAQRLYLTNGFRAVGLRAAYYRNPPEDALVLRREVEASEGK